MKFIKIIVFLVLSGFIGAFLEYILSLTVLAYNTNGDMQLLMKMIADIISFVLSYITVFKGWKTLIKTKSTKMEHAETDLVCPNCDTVLNSKGECPICGYGMNAVDRALVEGNKLDDDIDNNSNETRDTIKKSSLKVWEKIGLVVVLAIFFFSVFEFILDSAGANLYKGPSSPVQVVGATSVEAGITTDLTDINGLKSFTTNLGVHKALVVLGIVFCLASASAIIYLLVSKKERKNVLPLGIVVGACLIIGFGLLIGSAIVKSDTLYYKDDCISVNFIEIYKAGDRISADVEIVNGYNKSVRNIVLSNVILMDENGNVYAKADILKYDSVYLSGYRDHSYGGFYAIPVNDNVDIPDKTYVYYEYSYE